ncbi:MAG TPA: addiction module protein [Candidatus Kapabacteria bacterium]
MFRDTESLLHDALQLPDEDRLRVAERLFESVPEQEIAKAWLDEIELRKAAWDNGTVTGIDGAEVIRGLRDRARK